MKILIWIKDHVRYWAESYLGLPLAAIFIIFALHLYGYLTGRPSIDQPDQVVGIAYNVFGALVILSLTGFAQWRLFGYRSKTTDENPPLCNDIFDSTVTVFLLLFFYFCVFR